MINFENLYSEVNDRTLLDFSPADINLGKENYSCDQIIEMLENDEINLETIFQRKSGLWSRIQKSKFIESMMLRFPIPPLYFNVVYKDQYNKTPFWEVIDGLQRLYTIKEFTLGVAGKKLVLEGLDFYPELNGSTYEELPRHLIRNFKACQLQLHLVFPQTPVQVILRIFERINTTSLKLTPQEVRNAIYQGPIVNIIKNDTRYLFNEGVKLDEKRFSDNEVVLRFYSVYCFGIEKYMKEGTLNSFLDKSMRALNELSNSELNEISKKFKLALNYTMDIFGSLAFKSKGNRFNRTVFETKLVSIALLNEDELNKCIKNKHSIQERYSRMVNSSEGERFIKSVSNATSRPDNVMFRYSTLNKLLLDL